MFIMLFHKIRFQLGKLVQKFVSEGEKLRFRALKIKKFTGGACHRLPHGVRCFASQCSSPFQTFTSGYVPGRLRPRYAICTCLNMRTNHI